MSLVNHQKWVEMGKSLGFDSTELVKFVTESQATEQSTERDERARERDRDRERREQDDRSLKSANKTRNGSVN